MSKEGVITLGVGLVAAAVLAVGSWGMVELLKVDFAAIFIIYPLSFPLSALLWCIALGLGAVE